MATAVKAVQPLVTRCITSNKIGVVVSAGKMSRAVKVRVGGQQWNKKFQKHFSAPTTYLVRDPNNSLVEGDIVRITSGHRTSRQIKHVVTSIVAPFGEPVENRPLVLSQAQLDEQRVQERLFKDVRSAQRGRHTSMQRLAAARKQGLKIPTLEEATSALKAHEEREGIKNVVVEEGKEAHKGQAEQIVTKKERRKEAGTKTREEARAQQRVKEAEI